MTEAVAIRQDIRPMQIGLLNLMPNKIKTELQMARLLGASPLQVELTLIRLGGHKTKHTSEDHMMTFYRAWEEAKDPQVRRLSRHGHAARDDPLRGGHLLGRDAAHLRLDADQRPFDDECLLGRDGGALSFPRRAEARAAGEGVRRLPADRAEAEFALSPGFSDDFAIPVSRWAEIRVEDLKAPSRAFAAVLLRARAPRLLEEGRRQAALCARPSRI